MKLLRRNCTSSTAAKAINVEFGPILSLKCGVILSLLYKPALILDCYSD